MTTETTATPVRTVGWLGKQLEKSGTGRDKLTALRKLADDAPAEDGVEALRRYIGGVNSDGEVDRPKVADSNLTVIKARALVETGRYTAPKRRETEAVFA